MAALLYARRCLMVLSPIDQVETRHLLLRTHRDVEQWCFYRGRCNGHTPLLRVARSQASHSIVELSKKLSKGNCSKVVIALNYVCGPRGHCCEAATVSVNRGVNSVTQPSEWLVLHCMAATQRSESCCPAVGPQTLCRGLYVFCIFQSRCYEGE